MLKFRKYIQGRHSGQQPKCQSCIHFCNSPTYIEETFKGLTILSSGYASVKQSDGICKKHNRYLCAQDYCESHEIG